MELIGRTLSLSTTTTATTTWVIITRIITTSPLLLTATTRVCAGGAATTLLPWRDRMGLINRDILQPGTLAWGVVGGQEDLAVEGAEPEGKIGLWAEGDVVGRIGM